MSTEIVDETEVRRWFAEGRTYQFMVDEYARKYSTDVRAAIFAEYRRRHGLQRASTDPLEALWRASPVKET